MRRAALYARVSTRRQEQEATIESQLDRLTSYTRQHTYELPAELQFIDQAVSGKQLARPGLDRLRDAAAAGAFTTLLCLSPDRLARNLGAQQVVLDELRRADVTVIFLDQPSLGDSPQAKLLLDMQGAFAEYERVLISDRMRRGRLYRLRQGHTAPYPRRMAIGTNPPGPNGGDLADRGGRGHSCGTGVRMVHSRRLKLGALAQRLDVRHVPGPTGRPGTPARWGACCASPPTAAWPATTAAKRMPAVWASGGARSGPAAVSTLHAASGRRVDPVPRARPGERRLWQAAQERLAMQSRFAPRNSQHTYLLRGLLVCSVCGHTLQGRTQRGIGYYTCTSGAAQRPPEVPRHTRWLRSDVVEPLIWQALAELLREPQRIHDAWATLQTAPTVTSGDTRRQRLLQQQRQRLLDAYQAGALTLDELIQRQNPLDLELQELRQRRADQPTQASARISLEAFSERIQHALTAAEVETKQEVLRLLIERIVVFDDALTVEHIIPTVCESRLHPTHHVSRIPHRSHRTRSISPPASPGSPRRRPTGSARGRWSSRYTPWPRRSPRPGHAAAS